MPTMSQKERRAAKNRRDAEDESAESDSGSESDSDEDYEDDSGKSRFTRSASRSSLKGRPHSAASTRSRSLSRSGSRSSHMVGIPFIKGGFGLSMGEKIR